MDPTAMDDKLYYVESPDGQVLGPMTMLQILEGIAAEAILDSARICEVGRKDWIHLHDIAYTREVEPTGSSESGSPTEPTEPTELTESMTAGDRAEVMDEEPTADEDENDWAPDREYEAMASAEAATEPTEFATPTSAMPETSADLPPAEPFEEAGPDWSDEPAGDLEPDAAEPVDALAEPVDALAEPVDALDDAAVAASLEELSSESGGGGDFVLDLEDPEAASESDEAGDEPVEKTAGRRRWAIPVAIAAALPLVAGVYMLAGGKLPFLSPAADSESMQAAARTEVVDQAPAVAGPLDAAWVALREEKFENARTGFRDAIAENPENAAAFVGLARAELGAGNAEAALAAAEEARTLDPSDARALRERGRARLASGDPEGAVRDFADFLDAKPNVVEARRDLARALAEGGRTESAIDEINVYLTDRPEDVDSQFARLDWMRTVGRSAEAGVLYARLAEENPQNAELRHLAELAQPDVEPQSAPPVPKPRTPVQAAPPTGSSLLAGMDAIGGAATTPVKGAVVDRAPATDDAPVVQTPVVPAPKPSPARTSSSALRAQVAAIRDALAREDYRDAHDRLDEAAAWTGNDADTSRQIGLWTGIVAYEEGRFDDALVAFEALDPAATYDAAGWGQGAVPNWIARTHFARGDVRAAVAVLDQVGAADPDEYAAARLWEGVALASLGMSDLATRTWSRIPIDVGPQVGTTGKAAVRTAEFLTGVISEKDYRGAVSPVDSFENDMHWFLAYVARRDDRSDLARAHWMKVLEASQGREFPFHLAQAEVSGEGIIGGE